MLSGGQRNEQYCRLFGQPNPMTVAVRREIYMAAAELLAGSDQENLEIQKMRLIYLYEAVWICKNTQDTQSDICRSLFDEHIAAAFDAESQIMVSDGEGSVDCQARAILDDAWRFHEAIACLDKRINEKLVPSVLEDKEASAVLLSEYSPSLDQLSELAVIALRPEEPEVEFLAVVKKVRESCSQLVEEKPSKKIIPSKNLVVQDKAGNTILHRAAKEKIKSLLEILLLYASSAEINQASIMKNKGGYTPFDLLSKESGWLQMLILAARIALKPMGAGGMLELTLSQILLDDSSAEENVFCWFFRGPNKEHKNNFEMFLVIFYKHVFGELEQLSVETLKDWLAILKIAAQSKNGQPYQVYANVFFMVTNYEIYQKTGRDSYRREAVEYANKIQESDFVQFRFSSLQLKEPEEYLPYFIEKICENHDPVTRESKEDDKEAFCENKEADFDKIFTMKDQRGDTVFHVAAQKGKTRLFEILFRYASLATTNKISAMKNNKQELPFTLLMKHLPNVANIDLLVNPAASMKERPQKFLLLCYEHVFLKLDLLSVKELEVWLVILKSAKSAQNKTMRYQHRLDELFTMVDSKLHKETGRVEQERHSLAADLAMQDKEMINKSRNEKAEALLEGQQLDPLLARQPLPRRLSFLAPNPLNVPATTSSSLSSLSFSSSQKKSGSRV